MTAVDNLTTQLAELNPVPHLGPSGPDEAAEAERVLRRVLTSSPQRRVPLSVAGARVLTAGFTAVAIAVAAGALILLGHHTRSATPTPLSRSARQHLIQTFGVLRAAPTTPDHRLSTCIEQIAPTFRRGHASLTLANIVRCGGGLPGGFLVAPGRQPGESAQYLDPSLARGWEPQLLRNVSLPRWGDIVTLMPLSWKSSTSHQRIEGLIASVARRHSRYALGGTGPTSVPWIQTHGVAMSTYDGNELNQNVIIVPDGVARVTLGSFKLQGGSSFPALRGIARGSARVHHNVAALQLKTATVRSRVNLGAVWEDGIADATWYDASGKVIAHTTTALGIVVKFVRRAQ